MSYFGLLLLLIRVQVEGSVTRINTRDEFERQIRWNDVVFVYVRSSTCGECARFNEIYEKVAVELEDESPIKFLSYKIQHTMSPNDPDIEWHREMENDFKDIVIYESGHRVTKRHYDTEAGFFAYAKEYHRKCSSDLQCGSQSKCLRGHCWFKDPHVPDGGKCVQHASCLSNTCLKGVCSEISFWGKINRLGSRVWSKFSKDIWLIFWYILLPASVIAVVAYAYQVWASRKRQRSSFQFPNSWMMQAKTFRMTFPMPSLQWENIPIGGGEDTLQGPALAGVQAENIARPEGGDGDGEEEIKRINGYDVVKKLGQGGFGAAFIVKDDHGDQMVLKKVLADSVREANEALQEVKQLSGINHPNVVRYKDFFLFNKGVCIVMEFCEGGDLHDFIRNQGLSLEEEVLLKWIGEMSSAMAHVHQLNIIHRDLKPDNIFLRNGSVRIADFGLSRTIPKKERDWWSLGSRMSICGTDLYMAPEVLNEKPYGYEADVWSLGIVFLELAKGSLVAPTPYGHSRESFLNSEMKRIRPFNCRDALIALIRKMLENSFLMRYTMKQVIKFPLVSAYLPKLQRTRNSHLNRRRVVQATATDLTVAMRTHKNPRLIRRGKPILSPPPSKTSSGMKMFVSLKRFFFFIIFSVVIDIGCTGLAHLCMDYV
ncbi:hypothetical protein AAMO2058_001582700 [Amorphochlora amoebiformis]